MIMAQTRKPHGAIVKIIGQQTELLQMREAPTMPVLVGGIGGYRKKCALTERTANRQRETVTSHAVALSFGKEMPRLCRVMLDCHPVDGQETFGPGDHHRVYPKIVALHVSLYPCVIIGQQQQWICLVKCGNMHRVIDEVRQAAFIAQIGENTGKLIDVFCLFYVPPRIFEFHSFPPRTSSNERHDRNRRRATRFETSTEDTTPGIVSTGSGERAMSPRGVAARYS